MTDREAPDVAAMVKRLRYWAPEYEDHIDCYRIANAAADLIERQQAAIAATFDAGREQMVRADQQERLKWEANARAEHAEAALEVAEHAARDWQGMYNARNEEANTLRAEWNTLQRQHELDAQTIASGSATTTLMELEKTRAERDAAVGHVTALLTWDGKQAPVAAKRARTFLSTQKPAEGPTTR